MLEIETCADFLHHRRCAARSEVPRRGHGKTDVFQPLSFGSVDGVDGGQYTTYTMARPKFAGRMGLARALVLSDDEQIEVRPAKHLEMMSRQLH